MRWRADDQIVGLAAPARSPECPIGIEPNSPRQAKLLRTSNQRWTVDSECGSQAATIPQIDGVVCRLFRVPATLFRHLCQLATGAWAAVRYELSEGRGFMVRSVVIFLSLVAAHAAHAKFSALSGSAIKHLVSGAVMYINTPLNTKIPVRYGEDGKLAGAAGSMAFYLGAAKDTGRWWIARGRLCHKWTRWFDGDTQCLKLHKSGNKIFWASESGRTGTAMIRRAKPQKRLVQFARANVMTDTAALPRSGTAAPTTTTVVREAKTQRQAAPVQAKPVNAAQRARPPVKKQIAQKKMKPAQSKTKVAKKTAPRNQRVTQKKARLSGTREPAQRKMPSFRVTHVANVDMLNVRQGPSEYHPIVGRIPPTGRGVRIVGVCQAWWCPVVHRNVSGWVNRFYLVAER